MQFCAENTVWTPSKIPAGRLATPEQIAGAVVYLASEEAAMVNAHTLSVDGGWTAW